MWSWSRPKRSMPVTNRDITAAWGIAATLAVALVVLAPERPRQDQAQTACPPATSAGPAATAADAGATRRSLCDWYPRAGAPVLASPSSAPAVPKQEGVVSDNC